jgi:integrase/recombinase XerD
MGKPMRRANGQGSVYNLGKRRRKPWGVSVYVRKEDGAKIRKLIGTFAEKSDAEMCLTKFNADPLPADYDVTLQQIYDQWSIAKYHKITKATENSYRAAWLYLKPYQDKQFREIKTPSYQAIIDKAGKDKSRSTLEKIKALAVMLGDYAMHLDIVNKNYASYVELPPNTRSNKKSFTEDELKLIEKAAADGVEWADCVLMMCYTGFRITEFLGLTAESYDAAAMTLTGGMKTEAGKNRIIPIHPKILPCVKLWAAKGGKRLICKPDGSPWRSDTWRDSCYKPCLEKIKGVRPLDPHECRHTFATLLHAAHVDDTTIMVLMGHSDPKIDATTYIHVSTDTLSDAINKI